MAEYNVPKVKSQDGILLQASGGKELVFTQIELVGNHNLMTLKFIVGNNSLSVMLARGAARDMLDKLADQLGVKVQESTAQ